MHLHGCCNLSCSTWALSTAGSWGLPCFQLFSGNLAGFSFLYIHACMHVYVCVYIHIYIHTHIHIHIHMHTYILLLSWCAHLHTQYAYVSYGVVGDTLQQLLGFFFCDDSQCVCCIYATASATRLNAVYAGAGILAAFKLPPPAV
jgi:hypothetical protein